MVTSAGGLYYIRRLTDKDKPRLVGEAHRKGKEKVRGETEHDHGLIRQAATPLKDNDENRPGHISDELQRLR